MQNVDDKPVISGLRQYASDQYGLLITVGDVGGVGGDFSQTAYKLLPGKLNYYYQINAGVTKYCSGNSNNTDPAVKVL